MHSMMRLLGGLTMSSAASTHGRVGALVLSPFVNGGTWSTTLYNHYSLLASIEDLFGLPYLGYAATPGLNRFGLDVYNASV